MFALLALMVTTSAQIVRPTAPFGTASGGTTPPVGTVIRDLTTNFMTAMNDMSNPTQMNAFLGSGTKLRLDAILPCGGEYVGVSEIDSFFYKFMNTFNTPDFVSGARIAMINEGKGVGVGMRTFSGTFVTSQTPFVDAELWIVMEWNAASGILETVDLFFTDIATLLDQSMTPAVKNLYQFIDGLSKAEDLELEQPFWNFVSPDVRVDMDVFPTDLLPVLNAVGKPAFAQVLKDLGTKLEEMPLTTHIASYPHEFEVLWSDSTRVFLKTLEGKFALFSYYEFDAQGLLTHWKAASTHTWMPWELYKGPKEFRVLPKVFGALEGDNSTDTATDIQQPLFTSISMTIDELAANGDINV